MYAIIRNKAFMYAIFFFKKSFFFVKSDSYAIFKKTVLCMPVLTFFCHIFRKE